MRACLSPLHEKNILAASWTPFYSVWLKGDITTAINKQMNLLWVTGRVTERYFTYGGNTQTGIIQCCRDYFQSRVRIHTVNSY